MKQSTKRIWQRWYGEVAATLKLAIPIMAGMVGQMLLGIADTLMVGRIGVIPLAAASLVNTICHIPLVFGIGILSAISVLTAQKFGAKKYKETGEILRHGLIIAVIIGVLNIFGIVLIRYFGLKQLGQPQEVVNAAGLYLILFGISIFPALVTQAGKAYSEALNRPWEPTLILLGGVTLNIFLNWIFIYGNLGVPAMGLEGAGWATLIARILMSMVLLAYLSNSKVLRPFHPKAWWAALHFNCFRQLMTIGIPVAGQLLLEVGAFAFAAVMIGWISADAIAAHQIAITCAATTFMFPLGIGMAVCIRVGQAWGARRYARIRRTGTVGFVAAGLIMSIFAAMFILAGEWIAGLFIQDPVVIHLAANLLVIAALFQIADGFQVVAISALRGLSDVRLPAFIAIFAYWVVAVPLGWFLAFSVDLGARGIWIGLAFGLATAAVILTWRFHQKTMLTPGKP